MLWNVNYVQSPYTKVYLPQNSNSKPRASGHTWRKRAVSPHLLLGRKKCILQKSEKRYTPIYIKLQPQDDLFSGLCFCYWGGSLIISKWSRGLHKIRYRRFFVTKPASRVSYMSKLRLSELVRMLNWQISSEWHLVQLNHMKSCSYTVNVTHQSSNVINACGPSYFQNGVSFGDGQAESRYN